MSRKTAADCRDLEQLRRQIDLLDDELLKLLVERSSYVRRAVTMKPKERIVDAERIEAIIRRLKTAAATENLDAELVEKLWRALIDAFIAMERKIAGG